MMPQSETRTQNYNSPRVEITISSANHLQNQATFQNFIISPRASRLVNNRPCVEKILYIFFSMVLFLLLLVVFFWNCIRFGESDTSDAELTSFVILFLFSTLVELVTLTYFMIYFYILLFIDRLVDNINICAKISLSFIYLIGVLSIVLNASYSPNDKNIVEVYTFFITVYSIQAMMATLAIVCVGFTNLLTCIGNKIYG